jgi:hypothetical protein
MIRCKNRLRGNKRLIGMPVAKQSSIPESRSAGHATDTGLLFESAGVALD